MKHEALKQIENQDYWERERERGTFDSRNMQWKKKISPSYIKFVCYKRDKKKHFFRGKKKEENIYKYENM